MYNALANAVAESPLCAPRIADAIPPGKADPKADPQRLPASPAEWRGADRRCGAEADRDWRFLLLDEIDYGIFVLSAQGKLLYANHAALAHVQSGSPLRIEREELALATLRDTHALGSAIRAASAQALRKMMLVGTVPNRLALAVVPGPLCLGVNGPTANRVLVMLPRPRLCQPLSTYAFARDHGLSAAESQVLHLLCDGLQPTEIAKVHGVAITTVRTQIANIRVKTDAPSIAELIQRIARLPPICSALQAKVRGFAGAALAASLAA